MSTFKFFPEGWKSEEIEDTKDILQGIVKKHGSLTADLIKQEGQYSYPTYLNKLGNSTKNICEKLNVIYKYVANI